jgi:tetratricopeptide (TPR) repeat protein
MNPIRHHLAGCLAAALLAGCGGSTSTKPTPAPQSVSDPQVAPAEPSGASEIPRAAGVKDADVATRSDAGGEAGPAPAEDVPAGQLTEADRARFLEGVDALDAGNFVRAETLFAALSERYPTRASVWANLGTARMGGGEDNAALSAYQRALGLDAALAAVHGRLGILHARRGEVDKARQAYEAALEADPRRALVHLNLGILFERDLGQPRQALTHYREFMDLSSTNDPQVQAWIDQLSQ